MTWLGFIPVTLAIIWLWRYKVTPLESAIASVQYANGVIDDINAIIRDQLQPALDKFLGAGAGLDPELQAAIEALGEKVKDLRNKDGTLNAATKALDPDSEPTITGTNDGA